MILLDAKLLLYTYDARSPVNDRARAWLEDAIASEDVGLPLTTLLALIRM